MKTKKSFLLLLFAIPMISLKAQKQAGAGITYGADVKSLGLMIETEYFLNKDLAISPDLIIYLSQGWELNLNSTIFLVGIDNVMIYGLGGLNFSTLSKVTKMGINIGAGVNLDIGERVTPFAELKYILGGFDQLVLGVGMRLPVRF